MSKKLYLSEEIDDENVYTREGMLAEMEERGLTELKIFETKREKIEGIFYCKEFQEFTDKSNEFDNPCGKICGSYSPRNGKSGRCRHHSPYSHEPTDKFIVLKLPVNEV